MAAEGFKKYAANGTDLAVKDLQKWMKEAGVMGPKVDAASIQAAFDQAKSDAKGMKAGDLDKFATELSEKYKEDKKLSSAAQAKTELMSKLGGAGGGGAAGAQGGGCCQPDPCCAPISCPPPPPPACPAPCPPACPDPCPPACPAPCPPACPAPCPPPSCCPCPDCGGMH